MTPPPDLDLTMSSSGAESHYQPQNTQKQRKQNHTQGAQNKTNTHKNTKPARIYTSRHSLPKTLTKSKTRPHIYAKPTTKK